jgi:hypothetical protein
MYNAAFWLANLYVLPFWALMIFAPHWTWTRRIIGSLLILLPLAIAYTGLLIVTIGELAGTTIDFTPEGMARLLSHGNAVAVGWIHYLVFDLFVGRWAYFDSREREIRAWWVSTALLFINLVGPFGFLLYLGVRWLHGTRQRHTVS